MRTMISSASSSRVLLLAAPGTAADAVIGTGRIRRYRLARVPCGARPAATVTTTGAPGAKSGS
jgi:hypothetical protein